VFHLPERLHELAQFWLAGATKHFGYTKNWPTTCKGTFIEDYKTVSGRQKILQDTMAAAEQEAKTTSVGRLIEVLRHM
jgi:hypothetical protein